MITSGLVNQRRGGGFEKGFPHARSALGSEFIRPAVSSFDMPILEKSSFASPKTDLAISQSTPLQVNYRDIFQKTATPDERYYNQNLLKQLSRLARGPEQLTTQASTTNTVGMGSRKNTIGPSQAPQTTQMADRPRANTIGPGQPTMGWSGLINETNIGNNADNGAFGNVVDNPKYTMPGNFPGVIQTGNPEIENKTVQTIIDSSNQVDDIMGDADNIKDEMAAQTTQDVVTQAPTVLSTIRDIVSSVVASTASSVVKSTVESYVGEGLGATAANALGGDIAVQALTTQGGLAVSNIGGQVAEKVMNTEPTVVAASEEQQIVLGPEPTAPTTVDLTNPAAIVQGRAVTGRVAGTMTSKGVVGDFMTSIGGTRKRSNSKVGISKSDYLERNSSRKLMSYLPDTDTQMDIGDGGSFQANTQAVNPTQAELLKAVADGSMVAEVQRRLSDAGVSAPKELVKAIVAAEAPNMIVESKFSSTAPQIITNPISANIPEREVSQAIISNGVGANVSRKRPFEENVIAARERRKKKKANDEKLSPAEEGAFVPNKSKKSAPRTDLKPVENMAPLTTAVRKSSRIVAKAARPAVPMQIDSEPKPAKKVTRKKATTVEKEPVRRSTRKKTPAEKTPYEQKAKELKKPVKRTTRNSNKPKENETPALRRSPRKKGK